MAKTVAIDVKINAESGAKSLKDLKQDLKDLQTQISATKEGSEEYYQTLRKIGQTKDEMEDLRDAIASTTGAGQFETITKVGSSIAGGFAAAQGAMALFGSESKDLEKSMLKVQAAMSFAQGLSQLEGLADSFKNLKSVASNALNAIKSGISATGIGILLVAVGALVAYWDDIKGFFDTISEGSTRMESLNETLTDFKKGAQDAFIQINDVKTAFQQAKDGVLSKEEALKKYNETLGPVLGNAKDLNEAEEIMIKKADAYIKAQGLKAQANALFNKAAEEQAKALTANVEDQTSFIDKTIALFQTINIGNTKLANETIQKAQEKGVENAKLNAEKKKKIFEEEAQNLLKQADKLMIENDIKEKTTISNTEKNYKKNAENKIKIDKKYIQELETIKVDELNINQKSNEDILKSTFDFEQARLDILKNNSDKKKSLNQSNYDEEYEIAKIQLDKVLNDESKGFQDRLIAQEQFNTRVSELDEVERQRKEAAVMASLNITKDGLKATADLVSSFAGKSVEAQKKAFEFQKGVNIATAVIDTYQSAVAAYKSALLTPLIGNILAPIAAGVAVAAGIANIRKIEQTTFDAKGVSGGGGGGTGGGGSFAPNLSAPVSSTSTNLASIGFGENKPEPVKVFVTETDISNNVNKVKSIEQKASIE